MKLRSTEEYSCQAWTVSAISVAACVSSVLVSLWTMIVRFLLATLFYQQVVGIGAIGVALWQLIYSQNFILLIGIKVNLARKLTQKQ